MPLGRAILVPSKNVTADSAWMTCGSVNVESVGNGEVVEGAVVAVVAEAASVGTIVDLVATAGNVTPAGVVAVVDVPVAVSTHVRLLLAGQLLAYIRAHLYIDQYSIQAESHSLL